MQHSIKLSFFFLLIGAFSSAQMLNKKYVSRVKTPLLTRGLSNNYLSDPNYSGKTILLLTPSIPISFSRLEKDTANNWRIGPQMSIGGSYFFLVGRGYQNPNETIQIEPYFVAGLNLELGISQDLEKSGVVGSVNIGGVIGLYKYFNFLFSYDVVNRKPIFGIGARIDLFTLTQGNGTIILNRGYFFQ